MKSYPHGEVVEYISGGARVSRQSGLTVHDDWANPIVQLRDEGAAVEDASTTEVASDGREQVIKVRRIYHVGIVSIHREWRVRVRGDVMCVDGRPAQWRSPLTGWEAGTVTEARWADG